MLPHSLFSLPYGIVAILFCKIFDIKTIIAVLVALFSARSAANAFNRLADRKFDYLNPRTADRILPSGKINNFFVIFTVVTSLAVLFISVLFTKPICILLLPFAVLFCLFYSYTKRFSWLCHFYLGLACGLTVPGATLSLTGTLNTAAILLYFGVSFQVAGFDILYSIKDIEFDRKYGLKSIPAHFGEINARNFAKITFFLSSLCLTFFTFTSAGIFTSLAVILMAIIMQISIKKDFSLNLNGICSVLFLLLYCIDFLK